MGTKVPNSWVTLGIGFGLGIFVAVLLYILFISILFFGGSFIPDPSYLNPDFILILTFFALISGIPVLGLYFSFSLIFEWVLYLSDLFSIETSFWFITIMTIYFIFGIGLYLFNTFAQLYIIFIVNYPTPKQKRENQYFSILILILSTFIGLVLIINFNVIFTFIAEITHIL